MSDESRRLTRKQLAEFTSDPRTIRALEQMSFLVSDQFPVDITTLYRLSEEASIDAGLADGKAVAAQDALERIASSLEILASDPGQNQPNMQKLDYIDFNGAPPHADQFRRLAWNDAEDTLNLHHSGGVTQQVGQELYGYFINNIGSSVSNGEVIGFDAVANTFTKYIADGTYASELVIGIATQDIDDGDMGRATIWGRVRGIDTTGTPFGETWSAGDLLYVSPTVAGGMTNIKPTAPNLCIPIALVRVVDSVEGQIAARPIIEQQLYYGNFVKTTDQSPAVINTAYAITWDSALIADGISIGTPASRLVVDHAGLYTFNVSFQLTSSSASVKNVWLWFRKNGVDEANTSMITSLDSATAIRTPSRALTFSLQAGDYIELMFASDSTAMTIDNIPATAFAPAAPAAIVVINQEQQ